MSHDDLQTKIRNHDKQTETVKKLRNNFFNKCRLLEDYDQEKELGFSSIDKSKEAPKPTTNGEKDISSPIASSSRSVAPSAPQIKVAEAEEDEYEIGDMFYPPSQLKKILASALDTLPMNEVKVTLLGTYQNCTPGDVIVQHMQKHLGATTVSAAERIGQDLISHGFLRLVGNMGNTFANSSKMNYQWKPKAFEMAGKVPAPQLQRKGTLASMLTTVDEDDDLTPESPGNALSDMFNRYLSQPRPGETQYDKLRREATEADDKYKSGVQKLDLIRCNLEESIMDHLKFMERCELDRLKAIKAVILDFSGAVSNVIPTLQSTVDTMMLFQETVQPHGDLRFMIDTYRTGSFLPKVTTYESYYNSAGDQTFGVDLELRARGDRKRVPLIVTSILQYLDNHYPDLETDEARRGIWTVDVPLKATHHLRNAINNGKAIPRDILEKYDMPIVASTLKLYLLELPDSLVSSRVYDVIKTIYHTHGGENDDQTRLSVIQNTLGGLLLANIATLDALVSHFTRLIELTSAEEQYYNDLGTAFAPCILRPRVESIVTQHDKHAARLFRDLLSHKELIFGELKRERSLNAGRNRAPSSTDESSRKANEQARARAVIAARSRPSSPASAGSRNRRDSSKGGEFPRIPINPTTTSPTNSTATSRYRQSLEVPGLGGLGDIDPQQAAFATESSSNFSQSADHFEQSPEDEATHQDNKLPHQPPPKTEEGIRRPPVRGYQRRNIRPEGVSLSDKPVDD
ncbi:Myosin-IXa [Arthrobotrys entomopaga]|nr:Myosin-IXa [Arthrobotrys entomopaga]